MKNTIINMKNQHYFFFKIKAFHNGGPRSDLWPNLISYEEMPKKSVYKGDLYLDQFCKASSVKSYE
ncbi:hypothetical protein BpHYR1_047929 [Brachionus plicatilis]|uniref:Uncharacterized protein n=1 Tax=Brachionus plicatilis TaxID=10195 RepID=A0A3M7RKW2_BRAPC|nr:hypothetical protein BpHYR1_047929 [Brachionus plicatilis]